MARSSLLAIRRTDDIEAIVQRIWAQRPELKDKQAATLRLALGALDRELNSGSLSLPSVQTSAEPFASDSSQQDIDGEWD